MAFIEIVSVSNGKVLVNTEKLLWVQHITKTDPPYSQFVYGWNPAYQLKDNFRDFLHRINTQDEACTDWTRDNYEKIRSFLLKNKFIEVAYERGVMLLNVDKIRCVLDCNTSKSDFSSLICLDLTDPTDRDGDSTFDIYAIDNISTIQNKIKIATETRHRE